MDADTTWLTVVRRWLDAALLYEARRLSATYQTTPDELHRHFVSDEQIEALLRDRHRDALTAGTVGALHEQAMELAICVAEASTPLGQVAREYHLGSSEALVLAAVLAPEVDMSYRRVFGYLNDDLSRPMPTIDVLLRIVPGSHALLNRTSALFANRLLEVVPAPGAAHWRAAGLIAAEALRAFVLADNSGAEADHAAPSGSLELPGLDGAVAAIRCRDVRAVIVRGSTADESKWGASNVARKLGMTVTSWQAGGVEPLCNAVIHARLRDALLFLDVEDVRACAPGDLRWAVDQPVVVAVGSRAPSGTVLPDGVAHVELVVRGSASLIRTSTGTVRTAVRRPPSVQLVGAGYEWDDLVLPPMTLRHLRELVRAIEHRSLVFDDWGFRRLTGGSGALRALFTGSSGTGKTMSAAVISAELGLPLWKVDLSAVVSKYIGETEKNLEEVFVAVEGSGAILLFDEADALFGKRSEISDAHDRYANIQVAYLLQRIESFEGVLLLATNLTGNFDSAFTRRVQFEIEFPLPDEAARLRLWERALPCQAPRVPAVDVEYLARTFVLTGGEIRSVALSAAFLASYDDRPIAMDHLVCAVARQRRRQGKLPTAAEFGDYLTLIHGEAS